MRAYLRAGLPGRSRRGGRDGGQMDRRADAGAGQKEETRSAAAIVARTLREGRNDCRCDLLSSKPVAGGASLAQAGRKRPRWPGRGWLRALTVEQICSQ